MLEWVHDRRRHGLHSGVGESGPTFALWVVARARDIRRRRRFRALFGVQDSDSTVFRSVLQGSAGSFHSEVSTRKFPLGGLPVGPARIGRPPSAAAVMCIVRPLVQAFLACTPRLLSPEVHRTLAYRRGAQRAGGSVLRERCVRRGRRRPAPRHSKGAHAAARVRRSLCSKRPRAPFVTRPARAALRCSG